MGAEEELTEECGSGASYSPDTCGLLQKSIGMDLLVVKLSLA